MFFATSHDMSRSAERVIESTAMRRALVLMSGCRLAVIDLDAGRVLQSLVLADSMQWRSGHVVAASTDNKRFYVALTAKHTDSTAVIGIRSSDYAIDTLAVFGGPAQFPWVAVGRRTSRFYFASDWGLQLRVADSALRHVAPIFIARRDTISYGPVVWYAVSPNEQRVYASYHGAAGRGGTGVDWIDLGDTLRSCVDTSPSAKEAARGVGCANAHGKVVPYERGFLAATGEDLALFDSKGDRVRSYDVGLGRYTHFMEFAVDPTRGIAFAISPCRRGRFATALPPPAGISTISLAPGAAQVRILNSTACGSQIEMSPDGELLVVLNGNVVTTIESVSGKVLRQTDIPGDQDSISFVAI